MDRGKKRVAKGDACRRAAFAEAVRRMEAAGINVAATEDFDASLRMINGTVTVQAFCDPGILYDVELAQSAIEMMQRAAADAIAADPPQE